MLMLRKRAEVYVLVQLCTRVNGSDLTDGGSLLAHDNKSLATGEQGPYRSDTNATGILVTCVISALWCEEAGQIFLISPT